MPIQGQRLPALRPPVLRQRRRRADARFHIEHGHRAARSHQGARHRGPGSRLTRRDIQEIQVTLYSEKSGEQQTLVPPKDIFIQRLVSYRL